MYQPMPSAGRKSSFPSSLPAPVGGWNARDPISNMKKTDALQLDNMFPEARNVKSRKGSILFATLPEDVHASSPHNVRSLMSYQASNGTAELFAACEDGIYEVTAGGAISTIASAATNPIWQHIMLSNAAGTFMWCCNGVDDSRYYDGTNWVAMDAASTPALTGIVSSEVTNVSLFKTRLILCEKDSLSFWYLGINSISGAATEFPLGALFSKGGYLVATGSWTFDGGDGPDDYFAAITSEGEVVIYAGTDPSSAATWALKGIYYIGKPIGRRCLIKYAGDLLIQTIQGLFPMSKTLEMSGIEPAVAISDKINSAWIDAADKGKTFFGWQPMLYPEARMLLVNVPVISQQENDLVFSYQYVMNTQTKAWCRFSGMSSEVWGTHDGKLYYAIHNKIYQAWTGDFDEAFGPIDARVRQAFFTPGGGSTVQVKMIQPLFEASSKDLSVQMGIDSDYDDVEKAYSSVTFEAGVAKWDEAIWDESRWTGSLFNGEWRSVSHKPGRAISVRLRFLGRGVTLTWNATNLALQSGTIFN